ncbi:uncharacterized protein PHALS_04626 [Plasmopara halstedii]|uniref:Uncharacterized protein n=1 Tax=Plasmopara halstedii TaxID=4781 RepID=A0A0N7L3Y6_PLAHL|nr:uncharacterized protein PHALS_04626 [Plasmopara halstedii]CEG37179.1 hypothetical protein PHALS_04626 [Plasmopara halstedii]|eukprot:XP_024573548.1 hypothetical protein PHALS_04626 [Plasmopara halstedii]
MGLSMMLKMRVNVRRNVEEVSKDLEVTMTVLSENTSSVSSCQPQKLRLFHGI